MTTTSYRTPHGDSRVSYWEVPSLVSVGVDPERLPDLRGRVRQTGRMARLPGGLPVWRARRLLRGAGTAPGRLSAGPASGGPAAAVNAARHAALHSLVIEAAKYADTAPPTAISLAGSGTVRSCGGILRVGLPLVWGLPADHLRIVLAHELALPDTKQPDLVRGLLAAEADPKVLAVTGPLRVAVEQVRDAAAIAA